MTSPSKYTPLFLFYSLCEIKMQIMFDYFEHFFDKAVVCEYLVKFF